MRGGSIEVNSKGIITNCSFENNCIDEISDSYAAAIDIWYTDNVIIDNVCYTFSSDGANSNFSVIVTNSTLNGWTSYAKGYKSVSFTNCNFGKGTGGYQYAFMRPYNDTTFTNCVFEEGYEFDSTLCVSTFINCYYGDQLITQSNVASL